jgi:hypothetical protein
MPQRSGTSIAWVLVAVLTAAVGLLLWRPWEREQPSQATTQEDRAQESPELLARADEARKLHSEGKWSEAQGAWQSLIDAQPATSPLQQEAAANLDIAKAHSQPTKPRVTVFNPVGKRLTGDQPKPDQVAKCYPVGKKVRSVADLSISGTGVNKKWVLQGTNNFTYQYRVVVETTVRENSDTVVIFEQEFKEVTQNLAASKKELELKAPDSPILAVVWEGLEQNALNPVPGYRQLKWAARLANSADPGLKRILSRFADTLTHYGKPLLPDDRYDVQLVEQIGEFAGQRVLIRYQLGLGVTEIKVLNGKELPSDELERLAYHSSLLMDYFVSIGAETADNETFKILAEDIPGLNGIVFDLEPRGTLQFQRTQVADRNHEPVIILKVLGGDIQARGLVEGIERTGNIKPRPGGFIYYSADKMLVREARLAWDAEGQSFAHDSLLSGTEKLSNVKVSTYYEADVVKSGAK